MIEKDRKRCASCGLLRFASGWTQSDLKQKYSGTQHDQTTDLVCTVRNCGSWRLGAPEQCPPGLPASLPIAHSGWSPCKWHSALLDKGLHALREGLVLEAGIEGDP